LALLAATAAFTATGCSAGVVSTVVTDPAHADPGQTAFGRGANAAGGRVAVIASSVVVSASSDPDGPSEHEEGDALWRVRGGMLQFCHWADDGADDCRLATYEGFSAPPLLTFLPTIVDPTNLARGAQWLVSSDNGAAIIGAVASRKPEPVPFSRDQMIWITAGATALLGTQPVFLCAVTDGVPVCTALSVQSNSLLASFVLEEKGERVPVLWLHAGSNFVGGMFGGVNVPLDQGVFRCEGRAGKPTCVKAKEIE